MASKPDSSARDADTVDANDPLSLFLTESQIACRETEAHHDEAAITQTLLGHPDLVRDPATSIDDRRAALKHLTEEVRVRANTLDAQNQAIDDGLVNVSRATELLTTLEARLASLTEEDQLLRGSDDIVVELERRAAVGTAHLEQAARAMIDLEHEFAGLQAQLSRATETARIDVKRLADYRHQVEHGHSGPGLSARVISRASSVARRIGAPAVGRSLSQRRALVVGGLLAAVLLGVIAAGFPDRPGPVGALNQILRGFGRGASASALVSRSLVLPIVAVPTPPSSKTLARNLRSANDSVRLPAVVVVDAAADDFSRSASPAQFIGDLAIRSEPAGARVFVNQRAVGETPILVTRLQAGSYVVRIERERYQRWTTAINVPANRQARVSAMLQLDRSR